jgi:uncharacterized membrane protein
MAKKTEIDVLRRYVTEVDRFAGMLRDSQEAIGELKRDAAVKKQASKDADAAVREAQDVEHSTITLLLRFITPGSTEVLPLFDTMEPANENTQGAGATQWRQDPIAMLGLSAAALVALIAANIILVGQLQDRMQADPDEWAAELDGVTSGMAEAIAAKFHAYVQEHSK